MHPSLRPHACGLLVVNGQEESERAAPAQFTIHPNLPSMSLNQAFCNGQPESHAGRRPVHPYKILEDFLMMLGGNSGTGIADGHAYTIGFVVTLGPAVGGRRFFGYAALPKMEIRPHGDTTAGRSVLQSVIEQISDGLLYLLVIELEVRQLFIEH